MDIPVIQYLFESSIALLSFYLLYYWGLRKETFFQLNRWYLLLMPAVALIIPLLNIELASTAAGAEIPVLYPIMEEYQVFEEAVWVRGGEASGMLLALSVADLLRWVYGLGVIIMTLRLLQGLKALMRQMREAHARKEGKITYLQAGQSRPTASFFSYIFWNPKKDGEKYQLILEHEMVHVRQWHSLDVLLMELWVIIKWFNPIIYLYRRDLRLTHEYIADHYVVSCSGDRVAYAQLMVQAECQAKTHRLTHKFNSLTKLRLIMLAKSKSSSWQYGRFFLVLPITLTLFSLFSFNLASNLPVEVRQPFEQVQTYLQDVGQQELVQIPLTRSVVKLKWGEKICDCKPEKYKNMFRCENLSFSPRAYKRFVKKHDAFQLFEEAEKLAVQDLRIISSRMVDMGGYMGQFDESGKIDRESPLWQKPKVGDVYRFEFKGGGEKWFNFEVVINNRKEELEPAYILDLGPYAFSVDMTSRIGVRHFNFVDFQRAIAQPFSLRNQDGQPIAIESIKLFNPNAFRKETIEKIGSSSLDLRTFKTMQDVIAGDKISMIINTAEGEEIRAEFFLRKNASSQVISRNSRLQWGNQSFPLLPFASLSLKAEDLKALQGQTLSMVVNEQAFPIVEADYTKFRKLPGQAILKPEKYTNRPLAELERELLGLAPGASFFAQLRTADDLEFHLSIYVEQKVDWGGILADKADFNIQQGTGVVFIRNLSQEGLQVLSEVSFHRRGPSFVIGENKGMGLPLKDLPSNVQVEDIDYIKVLPPSVVSRSNRLMGAYQGRAIVYLK